jgi:ATP-dependent helicase HrpA
VSVETVIAYDETLPITAWHDEIKQAIADHQVVVVAGETGSGKTTQLPKICLELGRRSIGHTQPRRIAARTVAERVAEELQTPLGDLVGYQVRFTRKASRLTQLKVMTDGVLLAEIHHDRDLRRYDTIILDEAHERSLNIDFLIGYLKSLIIRRPDLKIVITSATIDTERFAAHFGPRDGESAPIIEVSGRTFPVEVRYRPLLADGEADQVGGIVEAVGELSAIGGGDILVFLSGEREIRDAAEALSALQLSATEVLPLYARLSSAEQHRVFAPHRGRRIVLATNVAETSLTVPGIRYVIDTGTARISRYSARTKVQRLPIEPISHASANQRAGRCGRVAPGVCIRLYSEEDFSSRPEFTEPEILRTNLASVILQMSAADLGDITTFPFLDAPDNSQIKDGLRLLDELGALSDKGSRTTPRLTAVGRRLAAMPVDPRMARMLLAAERQGCLREMLIIVSGLSIQDPRERPAEHRDKADALHARFFSARADRAEEPLSSTLARPIDKRDRARSVVQTGARDLPDARRGSSPEDPSDFLALLRLWEYLREAQKSLSGNGFRRMCREEFLHFLRVREWQDLHGQLKEICRELGLQRNQTAASSERVHTAALAGLLSHVGLADLRTQPTQPVRRRRRPEIREYLGARGTRFAINPGSSLAKVQPPLVMAAEIVETTRLWARTVAAITASQIEEVGQHLLKRQYSEPHWSAASGSVLAYETVSLYGVPIVAGRRVGYGKINPVEAREIFIRSALVEGDWETRHEFFSHNATVRAEAEALEDRTRRRDLIVDDQLIFGFYDARIPADIVSAAHFDSWWRHADADQRDRLTMTLDDLLTDSTGIDHAAAFPSTWQVGDHSLQVSYVFEPGHERDGVSVTIPVEVLNQIPAAPFSWQVPGLRVELATELIRSLPKSLRRMFTPAPDIARRALDWLEGQPSIDGEALPEALGRALRALTGEVVSAEDWRLERVPAHLRITFVVDAAGEERQELAAGKDLQELRIRLGGQLQSALNSAAADLTRSGARTWEFGQIAAQVDLERDGQRVIGYPALIDEGSRVGLTICRTADLQLATHALGLRRLVLLDTPDPTRWVVAHLSNADKLALGTGPYASVPALLADARLASVGELIRRHQHGPVRDAGSFADLCDRVRIDNADLMRQITGLAAQICDRNGTVLDALDQARTASEAAASDIAEQVGNLVFAGFLGATPYEHLTELPRYLKAVQSRIETLISSPARDAAGSSIINRVEDAYAELCEEAPPGRLPSFIEEVGWLIEELRVSLFAQSLRTRVTVSEKRVMAAIDSARPRLRNQTAY